MHNGLLIYNPKAGGHTAELLNIVRAGLPGVVAVPLQEIADIAARAAAHPWVAVAGGDGTVEGVATALIGHNVPLGVIPIGTYNNLARSLGLPLNPADACAVIARGILRPIDVGFANGKPFFECLGSGLDAALFPLSEEIKSGHLGRWFELLRRAYRYPRQRFHLTLDRPVRAALLRGTANESQRLVHLLKHKRGCEITLCALMLTVSNGPYFGMNFQVAPGQRIDDGFLTATVYSRYSKLQLWWHFFSAALGRKEYLPRAIAFRVSRLEVSGPRPLPVHLDGALEKRLWPLAIECKKGALSIFCSS